MGDPGAAGSVAGSVAGTAGVPGIPGIPGVPGVIPGSLDSVWELVKTTGFKFSKSVARQTA